MARGPNPYYAPAGQYEGIAEGVNNLASAFLSTPDPAATARAEATAWTGRKAREGVMDSVAARQGREQLGSLFENFSADSYDPRQILSAAVGSGAYKPGEIGDLYLTMAGNLPGMTDEQRAGALVGTGRTIGENAGVSLGDREGVATRNFENDSALQSQEDQAALNRALATERLRQQDNPRGTLQPVQYVMDDGKSVSGLFGNRTGYLDSQGQPLDMSRVTTVSRIGQPTGTNEDLGLTTGAQTALQKQGNEMAGFQAAISAARQVGQDERNFGPSGLLRSTVQDAVQAGQALGSTLSQEANNVQRDLVQTGSNVGLDHFDPNLSQLDMMENLLSYRLAKFNDPAGRVSDADFRAAKQSLGFGKALGNQADFMSRLDLLEQMLQGDQSRVNSSLGRTDPSGVGDMFQGGGSQQAAPQGGGSPIVRTDADYDALPPGAVFVDENGQKFRKPAQ